ncbi:MAG TPA: thioredoxin domain-containing protein, partial [Candidatus Nanopelagicales bacterium]|nr:thioredoxin domain-containing protein [Candidatus Nanopelagicales bacterium]
SSEPATQFATELLTGIASELGASSETVACIDEGRHIPFVAASTQNGFGRGVQGTPTVIVNGRTVENSFADNELIGLAVG